MPVHVRAGVAGVEVEVGTDGAAVGVYVQGYLEAGAEHEDSSDENCGGCILARP